MPTRIDVFHPAPAPGPVDGAFSLSPGKVNEDAPGRVEPARVTPLAPERYALQCTVSQSTYETLQYAQALLGHQVSPNDLPAVIERALKALVEQLEKRKFAKTSRPRSGGRRGATARHIPAEIKRRVWERDHGQCTFVSDKGQRCPAKSRLEFDHADPAARGGRATLHRIRLLCRAHNQYEAERVFGVPFMNHKREEAKRIAAVRKAEANPQQAASVEEVIPYLRTLGVRPNEARQAAKCCEGMPDAPLEERVRAALRCLAPPSRRLSMGQEARCGQAPASRSTELISSWILPFDASMRRAVRSKRPPS